MKTFAVIGLAGIVIFVATATYLLVGGEKTHVIQPVRRTDLLESAVKSQPQSWSVAITNVPPEKQQQLLRAVEEVMREEPAAEPTE